MRNDCVAARAARDAAMSEVERAELLKLVAEAPDEMTPAGMADLFAVFDTLKKAVEDAQRAGRDADNAALAFDVNGARRAYRRAKVAADQAEGAVRRLRNTK